MDKDIYYIVRGAQMRCLRGSHPRKINLPVSHGTYLGDQPVMTAEDNREVNIPYFGICGSGKCPGETISLQAETGGTITGRKCTPSLGEWYYAKKDARTVAAPLLTTESRMYCCYGGVIRFVTTGQDETASPIAAGVSPEGARSEKEAGISASTGDGLLGTERQMYENHSSIMEGLKDLMGGVSLRDGLNVKDNMAPWADDLAVQYAEDNGFLEYGKDNVPITWDNEADALRHFAWNVRMTRELSAANAETISFNHERQIFYKTVFGYVRFVPLENIMDEHNNNAGREYAGKLKGDDPKASEPYIKLFTEAKNAGKLILNADGIYDYKYNVYKYDFYLDKSKETALEVKDLGVKRGLLFKCNAKKEIIEQIDRETAEALIREYGEIQKISGIY
jgi:hypothetical protein